MEHVRNWWSQLMSLATIKIKVVTTASAVSTATTVTYSYLALQRFIVILIARLGPYSMCTASKPPGYVNWNICNTVVKTASSYTLGKYFKKSFENYHNQYAVKAVSALSIVTAVTSLSSVTAVMVE